MRKLLDEDDFEKFLKIIKEENSLQAESTDADKSKFFISVNHTSSHGGLSFWVSILKKVSKLDCMQLELFSDASSNDDEGCELDSETDLDIDYCM